MFESSVAIDDRLKKQAQRLEHRTPGYQILGAKLFYTPMFTFPVECHIQRPRRISLLEEFVLRAAIDFDDNDTPIMSDELAQLLKVDPLFITSTVNELSRSMSALQQVDNQYLLPTEKGRQFYENGEVPQPPETRIINLAYVPPFTDVMFYDPTKLRDDMQSEVDALPGIDYDSVLFEAILNTIDNDVVIRATENTKYSVHKPDEGVFLERIVAPDVNAIEGKQVYWAVFVIHDALYNRQFVSISGWNNPGLNLGSHAIELEKLINSDLENGRLELSDLVDSTSADLDEVLLTVQTLANENAEESQSRTPQVERLVQSELIDIRDETISAEERSEIIEERKHVGTAELVRDSDIRPTFMRALESAKKRVMIVSPWMTEKAVDDDLVRLFAKLASRRVIIVLGWGIGKDKRYEDRPPTPELLRKLHSVKTPEGLPAVSVMWLGNQHSKDVVIDDVMHLCGSHNWLSYRGDYKPRGESVYRVTLPEAVQSASSIIENLFYQRIQTRWDDYMATSRDSITDDEILHLISALIGIGDFDTASELVSDLLITQNRLLPLSVFVRTSGARLYGANPETRIKLFSQLGELLSDDEIIQFCLNHEHFNHLFGAIEIFAGHLAAQARDNLYTLVADNVVVWRQFGLIEPNEEIDSALERFLQAKRVDETKAGKAKGRKSKQKKK